MSHRIVYVIGQLSIGGTEKQLWQLVRRLDRARWQPYIACLSGDVAMASEFEEIGCPVLVIPRETAGKLRTLHRLWQLFRRLEPSIVHAFAYSWYLAIPAARFAGVPRVIVAERTVPPWKTRRHLWTDRALLPRVDRAIVNSRNVLESLVARHGINRDRCSLVYNGIDLGEFDALQQEHTATGGQHGSRREDPVVCAVANAKEDKQLDLLIQAFAIAKPFLPSASLWIIGGGPLRDSLEKMTRSLKIEEQVVFWGARSDLPALLRRATVGVNSSRIEGLCNAIIEYMAAKLPVVATDVGGNPEIVVEGKTGLLVPSGNAQALARAIVRTVTDRSMADRFGLAGRRRVETHFSIQRMVAETQKVYDEVLG